MSWGWLAEQIAMASPVARKPAAKWHRPNHLAPIDVAADFFGLQGDMLPVTRAEAMSVPAMARARHLIAAIARLPLRVMPTGHVEDRLIRQPDPTRTRQAVLVDTLDDLLFDGWSLWRVTARYSTGTPRHAEHVAHERVSRDPQDQRWLIDERPVDERDLLWFEGPHPGVLRFGGRALRAAVRIDRAYAATAQSPTIAVELHQTSDDVLTDEEISDLVESARAAVQRRGVLFTNAGLEVRTHTASSENLLIQGRTAAAIDIARMVGIPSQLLDAIPEGSSATYQNVQAKLREARDFGLDLYASAITSRLSMDDILPRGTWVAFDWEELLRPDMGDRMKAFETAIATGVYTVEECRALERGTPLEEA